MNINISIIVIAVLLGLLIAWGLWLWYNLLVYIAKKKTYTREYVALIGINAILVVTLSAFSYIFASEAWISMLNIVHHAICDFFGIQRFADIPLNPLTFSDKFFVVSVIGMVAWVVTKLVSLLDLPITERQYEEITNRIKPSIISDAYAYIKNDPKLVLRNNNVDKQDNSFDLARSQNEDLPWHKQVAELLNIISQQYKIAEEDYYEEQQCYISQYGKANEIIGILCLIKKTPTVAHKKRFIEYVKHFSTISNKSIHKLIIAIQDVRGERIESSLDDITIEYRYENELLKNLIDLTNYSRYIKQKFEKEEIIEGYSATLNDVYTSSSATIHSRNNSKKDTVLKDIPNIETYISDWLNNGKSDKQLAILGEYGQGKSVLAQRLCYLILDKKIKTDRIPILIELRGKFPKSTDRFSFFSDLTQRYDIKQKALMKLHQAGKLLIIFDGFDEMELVGDYTVRLEHFKRLWEFATPNAKFIITGRPNFFLDDKELKNLLRTSKECKNTISYCEEIHMKPFDRHQIAHALRRVDSEIKKDILETIEKQGINSSFYDLISRPTHLFMASVVWKERLSRHRGNINSALVYKEFLDYCYTRQDKKVVKSPLSSDERAFFMQGIAVKMAAISTFTNQIDQIKLRQIIIDLYEKFPNEITDNQAVITNNSIPLNQRFDKKYHIDTIFQDIRACGILVRDLSTFDGFKFAHKSFLEYLASEYCLNHILHPTKSEKYNAANIETISKNTLKGILNIDVRDIKKTPEIFTFILQLLCNKIDFANELTDEGKAIFLYKQVYPYPWIQHVKVALFLRPFINLDKRGLIFIVTILSIFYLICSFTLWVLIILFIFIVYILSYLQKSKEKKVFQKVVSIVYKKTTKIDGVVYAANHGSFKIKTLIDDNDNLLLWYAACKELNIPIQILDKIMTTKRRIHFDKNLTDYLEFAKLTIKGTVSN